MSVTQKVLTKRMVLGKTKSLIHEILPKGYVHFVTFRIHDKLAGNISISAGCTRKNDLCHPPVGFDPSIKE
jgi:hypothetical protein